MNKIKIILLVLVALMIVSACSAKETLSMEEQFKSMMAENQDAFGPIWHFEVKENVVIVFYEKDQRLDLGFIENNQGKWEWIIGTGSIDLQKGGYIATADMGLPFYMTVVVNPNEKIKEVLIQGEYAKLVQISPQNKVWFAFTETPSKAIDIEEIE